MFKIEMAIEAVEDLQSFRKGDQQRIVAAIRAQLSHQPSEPTRNRKRLKPNNLAEWELRVDVFRIFYDVHVEANVVNVTAIGYKQGNKLFVHGEEYEL